MWAGHGNASPSAIIVTSWIQNDESTLPNGPRIQREKDSRTSKSDGEEEGRRQKGPDANCPNPTRAIKLKLDILSTSRVSSPQHNRQIETGSIGAHGKPPNQRRHRSALWKAPSNVGAFPKHAATAPLLFKSVLTPTVRASDWQQRRYQKIKIKKLKSDDKRLCSGVLSIVGDKIV